MAEQEKGAPTEPVLDLSDLKTHYVNWYRILGTGEEMLIDLALTPNLGVVTADPIHVKDRLVLSVFTAKRLLHHLGAAVGHYENIFGRVEIDVPTRLRGAAANRQI
jgi:hypothetical protein